MAELSFGHNVRAKKTELVSGALNLLPWAQGCLGGVVDGATLAGLSSKPIIFSHAPVKMLGVSLPEYGSSEKLRAQLCNLPRELRDHEVLVQVHYAGLNPTDCKLRSGALQQLYPLSLPVILGCDFSGVVKKAGKSTNFLVGQKVFGRQTLDRIREIGGTYAEYCVVDAADLFAKPDPIPFAEAAAIPLAALSAFSALCVAGGLARRKSGPRRAVLVLGGSGGVGTFAVQIAKHYLECYTVATCSQRNVELLEALGADEAVDYSAADFWARVPVPALDPGPDSGPARRGYSVVLDCVGGDDYWQRAQDLLVDDGAYVTLVGPHRYGGEAGDATVGSAIGDQLQSGIRRGLGLLGAGRRYTVVTPSMIRPADLQTVAKLVATRRIRVIIDRVFSLYDVSEAHQHLESHRAVGKCVLRVTKKDPDEEGERSGGDGEDDDADGPDEDDRSVQDRTEAMRQMQQQMAARILANQKQVKTGRPEAADLPPGLQKQGTKSILVGSAARGGGAEARPEEGPAVHLNDATMRAINQAKMNGARLDDGLPEGLGRIRDEVQRQQGRVLETGIVHEGLLRRKKEAHGRFEDPYKAVVEAKLEGGVLTLAATDPGSLLATGEEDRFDLGAGWAVVPRGAKRDRFTLAFEGPGQPDPGLPAQVTLRAANKADGELWLEKLAQTAQWFANLNQLRRSGSARPAGGGGGGGGGGGDGERGAGGAPAAGGNSCGVGMVLRQLDGVLSIKRVAPGGPADATGKLEIGDVVLQVDGELVSTTDDATAAILGPAGSTVELLVERPAVGGGRPTRFTVRMKRGAVRGA